MNIDAKKINVLEGPWVDVNKEHQSLRLEFEKHKIPVLTQAVLPITRLHDDEYWWNLRSNHRITLAVPDFRHWLFEDDVFQLYAERIATVNFPMVALFESPLGFEMPPRIPLDVYVRKIFDRIALLASTIKERSKGTILLSPAISAIHEKYQQKYLDLFVHNRQYFDGYAVHCCNDMTEHTLGQLSSLLTQVMSILPRPVWVTKWAVPCFDDKVINPQVMGPSGWQPYKSVAAGHRLNRSFELIESLVRTSGSHWFYTGFGQDIYKPRAVPGKQEFWQPFATSIVPEEYPYGWEYWHFLGMMTAENKIKTRLLENLIRLAEKNNV